MFDPFGGVDLRCVCYRVVMLWKVFNLFHVKDGVWFHKGNILFVFCAGFLVNFDLDKTIGIHNKAAMFALFDIAA